MDTVAARIRALGLEIPPLPQAAGNFLPWVRTGSFVFLSGAIGTTFGGGKWSLPIKGKVGADISIEQGYESARYCALNHIAALQACLESLNQVLKIVKLVGYINAAPGFTKAPLVLDGASNLLVAAFGPERGAHARSAVYQPEMSFNAPLETDLVVEVSA